MNEVKLYEGKPFGPMALVEYGVRAVAVSTYTDDRPIAYFALKLNGEAGEVAENVGKAWRGDFSGGKTDPRCGDHALLSDEALRRKTLLELGDVLWYVNKIALRLGSTLEEVAQMNLTKLEKRIANVQAGRPAKEGEK